MSAAAEGREPVRRRGEADAPAAHPGQDAVAGVHRAQRHRRGRLLEHRLQAGDGRRGLALRPDGTRPPGPAHLQPAALLHPGEPRRSMAGCQNNRTGCSSAFALCIAIILRQPHVAGASKIDRTV